MGPSGGTERGDRAGGPSGGTERGDRAGGPSGGTERGDRAGGPGGGTERGDRAGGPGGRLVRATVLSLVYQIKYILIIKTTQIWGGCDLGHLTLTIHGFMVKLQYPTTTKEEKWDTNYLTFQY